MKIFLISIILLSIQISEAQSIDTILLKHNRAIAAKAQFYFIWGDSLYMELHPNKKIYRIRRGLKDGIYIATFDRKLNWKQPIQDTAMVVTILNGKENGLLQRWDESDKKIAEECEYKNGFMNGYRKLYFFDEAGNKYINIEIFENNLPIKTIQTEW
jgi:hypothetical protein